MEQDSFIQSMRVMRIGLLFALITLVFGFCLGGVFGAFEHSLKDHLKGKATSVLEEKYSSDTAKVDKALSKAWTYIKRAHIHANGLGTASLAMILFLAFCSPSQGLLFLTSLFLGIGSFGYSLFWLFAGLLTPSLGSSEAAKEALTFLAFPSSGLCLIGVFMTTYCCIKKFFLSH
ncbi:MAG: hypothetical protein K940chlam7_00012 [Chlamydiae bacterium]|nr:hypothetical protein [Chlamydiota bacterium]